jgi:hypothetical protein
MDALHSKAVIGLSLPPAGILGFGTPGYQFLDLKPSAASDSFEPAIKSPAGQISEDLLIDPVSNRLLSPSEGVPSRCYPPNTPTCHPNYEIANITYNPTNGYAQLQFFENRLDTQSGYPANTSPDSAAEDCNAQIALASMEGATVSAPYTTPYTADLKQADFTHPPNWTDSSFAFFPLIGSDLNRFDGSGTETGPIAVAQGGSHEGVAAQETFGEPANTITAFKLNVPYSATAPYSSWITCDIGTDPAFPNDLFLQGQDPHTINAYQSPNMSSDGTYHSFAVIANQVYDKSEAYTVAVVDLDMMLLLPQSNGVCTTPGGVLPQSPPAAAVVRFVRLCQYGSSCP